MILRLTRRLALAILLVPAAAFALPAPDPDRFAFGNESAAHPDGPAALLFNPAATGLRYPSEIALSLLDVREGKDAYRGAFTSGGFSIAAAGSRGRKLSPAVAFAGGEENLRIGFATTWIPSTGGRTADYRLGALSRPLPWLSLGAVADHLGEPRISGVRLRRDYTVGVALRPLAVSRRRARTMGSRLTLTADLWMRESDRLRDGQLRLGGEVEIVPGFTARGLYFTEDRGFQVGISLLGVHNGYHAQSGYAPGGAPRYMTHSASFHSGEDHTVLAGRLEPRADSATCAEPRDFVATLADALYWMEAALIP